jgi:Holliday junction resolvase
MRGRGAGLVANCNRDRGTAWETSIVRLLQAYGWPLAERRPRSGAHDKGDVTGIPGVVIEAKNEKRVSLAEYINETETEKTNADAALGVCWIKRRGKSSAGDGYVIMTGQQFVELLREAGY